MEHQNVVYDSVTIGALRMARRHWHMIAIAAVLGLVLAFLATGSGSSFIAKGSVDLLLENVTNASAKPDRDTPTIDVLSLARRVAVGVDDLELPSSTEVRVVGDQTLGSLTVQVSADSAKNAEAAFNSVSEAASEIAVDQVTQSVRIRIGALEQLVNAQDERVAQLDSQIGDALAAGNAVGPSSPLALQRATAAEDAATARTDLTLAQSQLASLQTNLVSVAPPTVEEAESSLMLPVAGAIGGAVIAFGALMLLQAVDGRLRRRIQIERDVAHAVVLGVVSKGRPAEQVAVLERTLANVVQTAQPERVVLVDLKGSTSNALSSELGSSLDVPLEAADAVSAARSFGDDRSFLLFVVPFGAVPQQVLQAAVADARTAGTTGIGVILTDVPARDHAWAAVSTR